MKNYIILIAFITLFSCESKIEDPTSSVTFWSKNMEEEIVITFDDTSNNSKLGLLNSTSKEEVSCGQDGYATFNYPKGAYSWSAIGSINKRSWKGIIEIKDKSCQTIELDWACYICTPASYLPKGFEVEEDCLTESEVNSAVTLRENIGYTCVIYN
jgi:hypothetical protein